MSNEEFLLKTSAAALRDQARDIEARGTLTAAEAVALMRKQALVFEEKAKEYRDG